MGRTDKSGQVDRLDSFDGIRALAISAVILLHAAGDLFPGGAFGVDIFFVLSSYLITSILLRERERHGRVDFAAFYWRRVFRLGPALILWLVVIAAPTSIVVHEVSSIPISTVGALLYFNDFVIAFSTRVGTAYYQSWSLSVEEQFYMVWPFVFALCMARFTSLGLRRAMVGFIAISIVVWLAFGNYFLPTGHLVPLALGCWAACWSVQSRPASRLAPVLGDGRVALGCLPVFIVALLFKPSGATADALNLLVAIAATALLLHCTLNADSWMSKVLSGRLPRWIGLRSYGIYLYGLTLLILVPAVTHLNRRHVLPLDLVVIAVVVGLSYRFVEVPLRNQGRAWLARRGEVESSDAELGLLGLDKPEGDKT